MTDRQKIEQLSKEDPLYGAMVKQIEQGTAHKTLIFNGGDPYTGYASAHIAKQVKEHGPGMLTKFWNWITDRGGTRGGGTLGADDD